MKTAVEWLVHELGLLCTTDNLDEIEEAFDMEKKQLILAHVNGQSEFDKGAYRQKVINNAEQYYNETFKQEQ